jgi:hypothetical protein
VALGCERERVEGRAPLSKMMTEWKGCFAMEYEQSLCGRVGTSCNRRRTRAPRQLPDWSGPQSARFSSGTAGNVLGSDEGEETLAWCTVLLLLKGKHS